MDSYLKSRQPIVIVQTTSQSSDHITQPKTATTTTTPTPSRKHRDDRQGDDLVIAPLNTDVCNWDKILNKRITY